MNYLQLPEVGVPVLDDKELRRAAQSAQHSAFMKSLVKSAEHKAKIGASVSKALTGKKPSAANSAAVSAALKGRPKSAEHKAKIAAALKANPNTHKLNSEIAAKKRNERFGPILAQLEAALANPVMRGTQLKADATAAKYGVPRKELIAFIRTRTRGNI